MPRRKPDQQAPKQAPKPRHGPLPLLPIDIAGFRLHLPLETLRDPALCPPGSEQQKLLLNALIDSHNEHHSPMIRQAEAQQASSLRGLQASTKTRQANAADTDQKLAALVARMTADGKGRKAIWAEAVREGLSDSANGAKMKYFRYMKRIEQAQQAGE